jgi:hypothetical protein
MPDVDLTSAPTSAELFCPSCGYDLRGIESERCPECGTTIDRELLRKSVIPWVHRKTIGHVRAFVKTVWLITAHPKRLALETSRPLRYHDALLFRWIVVVLATIPACGWTYYGVTRGGDSLLEMPGAIWNSLRASQPPPWYFDFLLCWIKGIRWWPTPVTGVFLTILAWSGAAGYFFHPRSMHVIRQNRAVALSAYTCAPLAWLVVPGIGWALMLYPDAFSTLEGGRGFNDPVFVDLLMAFVMAIAYLPFVIVFLWLHSTLRILAASTRAPIGTVLLLIVLLPLIWAGIAAAMGLVLPMAGGFLRLMIDSYGA